MMKKIVSLLLAVLMIAAAGAAGATTADPTQTTTTLDTSESIGEQNPFTEKDTPVVITDKTLVLDKAINAYNPDEDSIKAPTISYTYTIAAATVADGTQVTDGADKHTANAAVTAPVKAGIVSTDPAAPTIANNGVVAWTNADTMEASTDGTANYKSISIDFSKVVFTGAGIYRYEITEALTGTGTTYAQSGVTETTGSHTRYIDVYVKPAATFTDGNKATDWEIYGFTCFYNNTSITEADKTTVAEKTTGFVDGETGTGGGSETSTPIEADQYYTYNLTLTKTVVNDAYAAANTEFPFTVILTNNQITKSIDVMGDVTKASVTGWTDPAASAMSNGTDHTLIKGIARIKSGGEIKYIGIPNGTSVEVYETNVATGTTYKVDTVVTTASATTISDAMVNWDSVPAAAAAQAATKASYQSTKATFTTTADEDDDNLYKVAITNTLVTISPTGVVLRIAPYALILIAGAALVLISIRRKASRKEEE